MKNNLKAVFMSVRQHLLQQVGQGGGGESERLLHVMLLNISCLPIKIGKEH